MLSIVYPVYNELGLDYFDDNIKLFESLDSSKFEIIVVDGGSSDGTWEKVLASKLKFISLPQSNRAQRLKAGIRESQGDRILLHHPRTKLNQEGLTELQELKGRSNWGGFTHKFDHSHHLLRFTSWYSNKKRFERGVIYLDHCIFFDNELLPEPQKIPEVDIFEDTEISKILGLSGVAPTRLEHLAVTSAVRFVTKGIYKQAFKNQYLKWAYYFNSSDKVMNSVYEKDLQLNNHQD